MRVSYGIRRSGRDSLYELSGLLIQCVNKAKKTSAETVGDLLLSVLFNTRIFFLRHL
jgi:hypothetical protein